MVYFAHNLFTNLLEKGPPAKILYETLTKHVLVMCMEVFMVFTSMLICLLFNGIVEVEYCVWIIPISYRVKVSNKTWRKLVSRTIWSSEISVKFHYVYSQITALWQDLELKMANAIIRNASEIRMHCHHSCSCMVVLQHHINDHFAYKCSWKYIPYQQEQYMWWN